MRRATTAPRSGAATRSSTAMVGRLAAALFGAAAFVLTGSPSPARPLDEVKASNLLRVVAYDDNRPFSWSEAGVAKGIDVEIGRALARKLGVQAEIILRMQGEKVDDDLRANVWRGPLTGGPVGDVMLHVPIDKELIIRNPEAVMGNGYFEERVSVAFDAALTGAEPGFEVFKSQRIGVQLGTVADYFLMFYEGGALRSSIDHFVKPADGVDRFLARKYAGLMGVRSHIEGLLHEKGAKAPFVEPPMPGIVRSAWIVGTAVKENSRDLHYAVGNILTEMRDSGELARIFASHGVTYIPPTIK